MTTQHDPMTTSLRRRQKLQTVTLRWLLVIIGSVSTLNIDFTSALGQSTQPLQHLWEVQPDLGDIWSPPRALPSPPIDLEQLASPHAQERMETARLISFHCDRPSFPNRGQAIEKLLAAINRPGESTLVRRALFSAACAVDDGSHADMFWALSGEDPEMKIWIQRALIRWKSDIAIDSWREVVRTRSAPPATMRLALEGLAVVGTKDDQAILMDMLGSESVPLEYRLLASIALGGLRSSGLTAIAQRHIESDLIERDLIAFALMKNHADEGAKRVVTRILETGRSPAKRLAATWLATHAPEIAKDWIEGWSKDPDAHHRQLALQLVASVEPHRGIPLASALLADEDPLVRSDARRVLREFAVQDRETVDASIEPVWHGSDPRGIVQVIVLSVELADESRCALLLDMLDHSEPDVQVHAAWALRELCQTGPILDQIFAYAVKMTEALENGVSEFTGSEIIKLSFLLESLGRHRYEPSLAMLVKYIPKNGFRMQNLARTSAIWAIGQLKKNVDDPSLRAELQDRIMDTPPNNPENFLVRFACMLALGEFAFRDSLAVIDPPVDAPPSPLVRAARWAKDRIESSGK